MNICNFIITLCLYHCHFFQFKDSFIIVIIQFNSNIMKGGHQVLSKIENLLTQIDAKSKYFRAKPSPRQQENFDANGVYQKLYEDYKRKKMKQATKEQEKNQEEALRLSPFKVTNKHTLFINSQQQQKPIHLRLDELSHKKMEEAMRLKKKYPKREEDSFQREDQFERKTERRYTKQELDEKINELQSKQRARIERLNKLKLQAIQEHSKDFRCKPYVNKESESLWKIHQYKKQLSTSVFQRFEQYQVQRKTHLQNTERELKNKITPFAPRISENSRMIVSRSHSKSNIHKIIERSLSCKCLQRQKSRKSTAMNTSRNI